VDTESLGSHKLPGLSLVWHQHHTLTRRVNGGGSGATLCVQEETTPMITALIVICLAAGALTWFALTDFSGGKRNDKRNDQ